jgi:hypothetical protein
MECVFCRVYCVGESKHQQCDFCDCFICSNCAKDKEWAVRCSEAGHSEYICCVDCAEDEMSVTYCSSKYICNECFEEHKEECSVCNNKDL